MDKEELVYKIQKLKEEIRGLKATQNLYMVFFIVKTAFITSMFMHMFIL